MDYNSGMKICSKCKMSKSLSDFYNLSSTKDGKRPDCKDCRKLVDKKRYLTLDKEKVNARARENYKQNRENVLAKNRKKYHENLEKEKERSRLYREKNKQKIKEKTKKAYRENQEEKLRLQKWKLENPDKVQAARRKRRALVYGVTHKFFTIDEVIKLYGTACHICGEQIDLEAPRKPGATGWQRSLHIDHLVPLAKGGVDSIENARPAHGQCNLRKGCS